MLWPYLIGFDCFCRFKEVFQFRSKGRIPVLAWKEFGNQTVIMRSAQPLVGITGQRCEADELLLKEAGILA